MNQDTVSEIFAAITEMRLLIKQCENKIDAMRLVMSEMIMESALTSGNREFGLALQSMVQQIVRDKLESAS